MTNKHERFLVMSEAEFEAACAANWNGSPAEVARAEAACRAKEVEYVATISHEGKALWVEK